MRRSSSRVDADLGALGQAALLQRLDGRSAAAGCVLSAARRMSTSPIVRTSLALAANSGDRGAAVSSDLEVGLDLGVQARAAPRGPRRAPSPGPPSSRRRCSGVGAVSVSGRLGGGRRCQRLRRAAVVGHRPVPSLAVLPPGPDPLTLLTRGQSTSFPGAAVHLFGIVACTGRWPASLALASGSGSDCGPSITPATDRPRCSSPPALTGSRREASTNQGAER